MSFFRNIFRSNKSALIDYSDIKVDFHSHLIPGIDDGAKTYADAIKLIKELKELGFEKLITTPHIMSEFFRNTPKTIKEGLEKLKLELDRAGVSIEIDVAAEYLIDDGFEEKFRNKELLTFSDNYLLIELSTLTPPYNLKQLLFELQIEGYKIILAHPERYTYWMGDFKQFEDLKNRNVYFQLNTVSLTGYYPEPTKKFAHKLIDANMIDFIGSDCHNNRYFNALEKALSENYLKKLIGSGKLKNQSLL